MTTLSVLTDSGTPYTREQLFGGKLATVWSAPNYCHRYENLASILELDENLNEHFNIFEDAPENKREKKEPKPRDVYAAG